MEQKEKGLLHSIHAWGKSVLSMPSQILFGEIVARIKSPSLIEKERTYTAHHEAAHIMGLLFAEQRLHKFAVGKLRDKTYSHLGRVFGDFASGGSYAGTEDDEVSFTKEQPEDCARMMLAGLAATKVEYPEHFADSGHADRLNDLDEFDDWLDLSQPYQFVKKRSEELGVKLSEEQIARVVQVATERLGECFKYEKFQRIMKIVREYVLNNRKQEGRHVHDALLRHLEAVGVTPQEFEECQRLWRNVSFDQLIQTTRINNT